MPNTVVITVFDCTYNVTPVLIHIRDYLTFIFNFANIFIPIFSPFYLFNYFFKLLYKLLPQLTETRVKKSSQTGPLILVTGLVAYRYP